MKKSRSLLLAAIIPLALYGQPVVFDNNDEVAIKKEKLDAFSELEISNGSFVTVQYSEAYAISIIGNQNCIDAVQTTVSANRLFVSSFKNEFSCSVEIVIESPQINDITLRDGGYIDATAVTSDTMFAAIYDGGEIKLAAHEFLYGKIVDGGVINYVGSPDLITDIVGNGIMNRIDPLKHYQNNRMTLLFK